MCCIFTCCGWMIDLIQRLWTFTMSCCISSAVCCSLLTASMSGIALGYNYSLAEYIDLKETNVSIYLKRGVFDDDIADDMDWRRSGHMPVEGHIRDQNLLTGAPDDESTPLRAGRRLDDTIFESNDKNSFEGALMKLTAKPPADRRSETYPELNMQEVFSRLPSEPIPIDQLKAVQSAINMQKAAEAERRVQSKQKQPNIQDSGRRMLPRVSIDILPREEPTSLNSLRLAVPDQGFHNPGNWVAPKYNSKKFSTELFDDYSEPLTLPTPVSARPAPIRPSRPRRPNLFEKSTKPTLSTQQAIIINSAKTSIQKDFKDDMLDINEKLLLDKFDDPSFRDEEIAHKMKKGPNQSEEDYEDDIKGIPIRKKRNLVKKHRGTRDYVKETFISKLYYLDSSSPGPSKKIINVPKITYQDNTEIVNTLENTDKLSDTTFLKLIMSCTLS